MGRNPNPPRPEGRGPIPPPPTPYRGRGPLGQADIPPTGVLRNTPDFGQYEPPPGASWMLVLIAVVFLLTLILDASR